MAMTKKKAAEIEKKYHEQKQPKDTFMKLLVMRRSYLRTELNLVENTIKEFEDE